MNSFRSVTATGLFGALLVAGIEPAQANETQQSSVQVLNVAQPIREFKPRSIRAADLLAQDSKAETTIAITGVTLNPTASGLEVVLQRNGSVTAQPMTRTEGNNLITDIEDAVLELPGGSEFQSENPAVDISSVRVTQLNTRTVRVTVMGVKTLPSSAVVLSPLPMAQKPATALPEDEEEEEITVTGQQQKPSYRVPNASVTGTSTPILETPFSVQVIPQQSIRDQQVTQIKDAVGNVSGVSYDGNSIGRGGDTFSIRGFSSAPVLLDGFRRSGSAEEANNQPNLRLPIWSRSKSSRDQLQFCMGRSSQGID